MGGGPQEDEPGFVYGTRTWRRPGPSQNKISRTVEPVGTWLEVVAKLPRIGLECIR